MKFPIMSGAECLERNACARMFTLANIKLRVENCGYSGEEFSIHHQLDFSLSEFNKLT